MSPHEQSLPACSIAVRHNRETHLFAGSQYAAHHHYGFRLGYRTIGKAVGMSQNTVAKHVAGLIEKQLIYAEPTTVQTRKGKKHNGNLLYTIRPIQDAVDYYNERLLLNLEAATEKQCIQKQLDAQKQLHPDSFEEGGDCA